MELMLIVWHGVAVRGCVRQGLVRQSKARNIYFMLRAEQGNVRQGTVWYGNVRYIQNIYFMFLGGAAHGRVRLSNAWLGGARYSEAWNNFYARGESRYGGVLHGPAAHGPVW